MKKKLEQIRKQIAKLRKEEDKIILLLRKTYEQEKGTLYIPNIEKTTWKKLEGQVHRSTLWRRAKKLNK